MSNAWIAESRFKAFRPRPTWHDAFDRKIRRELRDWDRLLERERERLAVGEDAAAQASVEGRKHG